MRLTELCPGWCSVLLAVKCHHPLAGEIPFRKPVPGDLWHVYGMHPLTTPPLPTTFLLPSPSHPSLLKVGIRFVFKPLKRGNLLPNLSILRIKQEHTFIEMCNWEWFTKTAIPGKYIQLLSISLKHNYIKCWSLHMSTGKITKILISHCGCMGDQ